MVVAQKIKQQRINFHQQDVTSLVTQVVKLKVSLVQQKICFLGEGEGEGEGEGGGGGGGGGEGVLST